MEFLRSGCLLQNGGPVLYRVDPERTLLNAATLPHSYQMGRQFVADNAIFLEFRNFHTRTPKSATFYVY